MKWYEDPIYIKMCDCPEIQELDRSENTFANFFVCAEHYESMSEDLDIFVQHMIENRERLIWLPRQDQLQEMVCRDWGLQTICTRLEKFSKASDGGVSITISGSMEQLWLAFVMKEKFNKTWDGEKWSENG